MCINTSIQYEKQIFAAAHELYHIWFDEKNAHEVILSSNLEETESGCIDINELKANRFAAEFLAETKLLEQEIARYGIAAGNISIKEVLQLCDIFTIPYKTMARRLHEISIIDASTLATLLSATAEDIMVWNKILGITAPYKQNYIRLDNLIERSVELYKRNLITYEKLEYYLEFARVSPAEVGLVKSEFTPLTDDDIADIQRVD